ncbi:MAG: NAD(+) synthase [Vicinamibacterales bacterium]
MTTPTRRSFTPDVLAIDAAHVAGAIEQAIRQQVAGFRRRGAVVGLSGGIDSSVVTCLCARALGRERVQVLFMPERDSSPESLELGQLLTTQLGLNAIVEDIAPTLEAAGCYARQAEAVRMVFPEFTAGYRLKVALPSILDSDRLNVTELTIESPSGERKTSRLPVTAYLQLIAATNFKQRVRKLLEYYHADRLNYVVAGTPNRLEYDQGFFVKGGDGAADIKPIAHLYKSQVYALADYLGIPAEIRRRPPTTDTFSLPQTQEEFYFALPYAKMDLVLYGRNHSVPAAEVAPAVGLTPEQVERVYKDIDQKRRTTRYLHTKPLLVEPVPEVGD